MATQSVQTVRYSAPRSIVVRFSGVCVKTYAVKRRTFTVVAPDTYTAMDLVSDKHKLRDRFVNRVFLFGLPKLKLSAAAKRAVLNAGPDEE